MSIPTPTPVVNLSKPRDPPVPRRSRVSRTQKLTELAREYAASEFPHAWEAVVVTISVHTADGAIENRQL